MKYRIDYYYDPQDFEESGQANITNEEYRGTIYFNSEYNLEDLILEIKKDDAGHYISDGYKIESTCYEDDDLTIIEIHDFWGHISGNMYLHHELGEQLELEELIIETQFSLESYVTVENFDHLSDGDIEDLKSKLNEIERVGSYEYIYEWGASSYLTALLGGGTIQIIVQLINYLKNKGVNSYSINDKEIKLIKEYLHSHAFPTKEFAMKSLVEKDNIKTMTITTGQNDMEFKIEQNKIIDTKIIRLKQVKTN